MEVVDRVGEEEEKLNEALKQFLLLGENQENNDVVQQKKKKVKDKAEKCAVCLGGPDDPGGQVVAPLSEAFSEQVLRVVLQVLLVPPQIKALGSVKVVWLCLDCSTRLTTLTDLFFQLEEVQREFNDLRRSVGRQVIVDSMGRSLEVYGMWEERVKMAEDLFPSSVLKVNRRRGRVRDACVGTGEDVEVGPVEGYVKKELMEDFTDDDNLDFCDFVVEPEPEGTWWENDVKLKKMTPIVRLRRLTRIEVKKEAEDICGTEGSCSLDEERKIRVVDSKLTENLNLDFPRNLMAPVEKDNEDSSVSPIIFSTDDRFKYSEKLEIQSPVKLSRLVRKRRRCAVDTKVEMAEPDDESDEYEYDPLYSMNDANDAEGDSGTSNGSSGEDTEDEGQEKSSVPKIPGELLKKSTESSKTCSLCQKTFSRHEHVRRHLRNIHGIDTPTPRRIFKTDEIDYDAFYEVNGEGGGFLDGDKEPDEFSAGEKSSKKPPKRSKESWFTCTLCNKKFTRRDHVRRHLQNIHGIGTPTPPRIFKTDKIDYDAIDDMKGEGVIDFVDGDKEPDEFSADEEPSKKLPKRLKKRSLTCSLCQKTFSRRDHVTRHIREIHLNPKPSKNAKLHGCPQCDLMFKTDRDVQRHIRKVHDKDKTPARELEVKRRYECSSCPKSYGKATHLVRHKKEKHNTQEQQCPSCPEKFLRETALLNHRKTVHDYVPLQPIKKSRQCEVCLRVFSRPEHLRRHKQTHTVIRDKWKFPCTHCDLIFSDRSRFKTHTLRIHFLGSREVKDPMCQFCLKFFHNQKAVEAHQKYNHFGDQLIQDQGGQKAGQQEKGQVPDQETDPQQPLPGPSNIRCFLCKDSPEFLTADELAEHEAGEEHTSKIKAKMSVHCNLCKKNFKGSLEALHSHLQSPDHLNEQDAIKNIDRAKFCVPCRMAFETREALLQHHTTVSHQRACIFRHNEEVLLDVPKKCQWCSKTFDLQIALDVHVQSNHNPAGHSCQSCDCKFAHLRDLRRHQRSYHEAAPKNFICEKCGKSFDKPSRLAFHNKLTHELEVSVCDVCGKEFPTRLSFEIHRRARCLAGRGKASGFYSNDCSHCPETFKTPEKLRKHLVQLHPAEHLKENPYFCVMCFHVFPTKDDLAVHKGSHKSHKCGMCGKEFKQKDHLERHIRMHTGEKPFKCTECGKGFQTNGNLREHLTRHTGKKPYECPSCDASFWRKNRLEKHLSEDH